MTDRMAFALFCSCGKFCITSGPFSYIEQDIANFFEEHAEKAEHEMYTYHGFSKAIVTADRVAPNGWRIQFC